MVLNKRRRQFLFTLTHQLRCMLLLQVLTWGGWRHIRTASTFLAKLEKAGLVVQRRVLMRPLPQIIEPLWATGQPEPSYYRIAYEVQARFKLSPKQHTLWLASSKAVNLVGGTTPKFVASQATHDSLMTSVYLAKLQSNPEQITDWIGEDIYAKAIGEGKLPDALLFREGLPYLAVESAGCSYNAARIQEFIEYCNQQQLACEVW